MIQNNPIARVCWATVMGLVVITAAGGADAVYLTWQGDTGNTMTVNFHTQAPHPSIVYYDTVSYREPVSRTGPRTYSRKATGAHHQIRGLVDGPYVHWVELRDLRPGGTYYFVVEDPAAADKPREYKFRTVAAAGRLRFVVGGDMTAGTRARRLLEVAAAVEPQFALLGGDLAYANGKLKNRRKWQGWFENWTQSMTTPDGFLVPVVVAIGNHEVNGGYGKTPAAAPYFFGFFAQAGNRSYTHIRFGDQVVLYVLDSGHVTPHGGEQAEWLASQMERNADVAYSFAAYHVPLYPGYRSPRDKHSRAGRRHWLPLFDRHGLTTAFEHHDHVLKRSKRLKENRVDASGTLYLGDGCMGKPRRLVTAPRQENRRKRWYIANLEGIPHFWQVDVDGEGVHYRAIDEKGKVVDAYRLEPPVRTVD